MIQPYSQSCENNKHAILQIIQTIYIESKTVWEIGSGTGQHACFFARKMPHISWQPTDMKENVAGIDCWIEDADLDNLSRCLILDVVNEKWPCQKMEALFTANTLHIMHWNEVESFFNGLVKYLANNAFVCLYGPFNYNGQYTSTSNRQFDHWLNQRDSLSGIRDFEAIEKLAYKSNLILKNDFSMPANNRLLVFQYCEHDALRANN